MMKRRSLFWVGSVVGIAGGAAEVAWVLSYSELTGTSAAALARGVTKALVPPLSDSASAVGLGIVLHMMLAILLGIAVTGTFSTPLLRQLGGWHRAPLVVLALGGVWAFNFLVVLPILEPGFVTLMPLTATLASKLLFGVAAAITCGSQPCAAFGLNHRA